MGSKNKLTSVRETADGKFRIECRQCERYYVGPARDTCEEAAEDRTLHRKYAHNPEFLHARYLSDQGIEIKRLY